MEQILNGKGVQVPEQMRKVISGSSSFTAQQRLAVYQQGYRLRLIECLAAEFPVLQLYLGNALFDAFAHGYISRLPSSHYSLYQLGERFADFLEATRPKNRSDKKLDVEVDEQAQQSTIDTYLCLPEQIARVERAQAQSLRGDSKENKFTGETLKDHSKTGLEKAKGTASLSSLFTTIDWPKISLPATSFLVVSDFNLLSYLQEAEEHFNLTEARKQREMAVNEDPTKPQKPRIEKQSLLVFRNQFQVNIARLNSWQTQVIQMLQTNGYVDWQKVAQKEQIGDFELHLKAEYWVSIASKQNMISIDA